MSHFADHASTAVDGAYSSSLPVDGYVDSRRRDGSVTTTRDGNSPSPAAAQRRITELEAEIAGLRERQRAQGAINQALGMLMSAYGITADTAFAVLTRWSQNYNIKVRTLAASLVDLASQPHDRPGGALRAALADLDDAGSSRTSGLKS